MLRSRMSRRLLLKGTAALGAVVSASSRLVGQQAVSRSAAAPGVPLPPRGEFVIRGATVLSMDPNTGDFAAGDVQCAMARSSRWGRGSMRRTSSSWTAAA